jgi:glycosyltransferase involved in cell wall biosynthesis
MTATKSTLCIGILTMNEERRIEQCIQSARFADQIVVVDSGSKDQTVVIAQRLGAQVHTHADWQGFAVQRNRLIEYCTSDYIFFLDADEVITPELQAEIQAAVQKGQQATWEVLWNQVAYGKALTLMKSTGGVQRMFPTANLERFEGVVHEKAIVRNPATPVVKFKGRLLHYSRETVYGSLQKLAQYAQLGALKRAEKGKRGGVLRGFASALVNFVQLYIFRRGFLCGAEGFLFCFFIALECFFRYAMLKYDKKEFKNFAKR